VGRGANQNRRRTSVTGEDQQLIDRATSTHEGRLTKVPSTARTEAKTGWRDIVRTLQNIGPGRTNDMEKEDWAFALEQVKRREEAAKKRR
jgi:hypothetical protein